LNKLLIGTIFAFSISILISYQEAEAQSADLTWTGPMIISESTGNTEPFIPGDFISLRGTILNQGTEPAIAFSYQMLVFKFCNNTKLTTWRYS